MDELAKKKYELEKAVWILRNDVAELEIKKAKLDAEIRGGLQEQIMASHAKYLHQANEVCAHYAMPPIPSDVTDIPRGRRNGKLIRFAPEASGIYFIWHHGEIVYVGCSINLRERLTSAHNQIIHMDDYVSWMTRPLLDIELEECFYIWLLRPDRNGQTRSNRWRVELAAANRVQATVPAF